MNYWWKYPDVRVITKALLVLIILMVSFNSHAYGLLFNGDFESGTLQGWSAASANGGLSQAVAKNTCFSANDTTAIDIHGSYAARIRSSQEGDTSAIGALTSDAFTAGNGIAFIALSESVDSIGNRKPVNFEVHITNASGETLAAHPLITSVIKLAPGCPSSGRSAAFSGHYIDTRPFLGTSIRIQFRQHTLIENNGFFTLIDNIIKFDSGELPIFTSKPTAVAGISIASHNVLRLDGSLSIDPDEGPQPLSYKWFIDDDKSAVFGEFSCIDELPAGEHTVTLTVNDGINVDSDTMKFVVVEQEELRPSQNNPDDPTQTSDGTTGDVFIELDGCSEGVRLDTTDTTDTTGSGT